MNCLLRLHGQFFQVLNDVTKDVEKYMKRERPCLTEFSNQPTRELKISFKNFELFTNVVKNCVEYSMNLLNRNKHKLENEKSIERQNSSNKDKKIIKTYYQYIALFTKNSLHFLNIFFDIFCTKFLVRRETSEKILSSDKITSIFRSQKYWKRFYTASLLLKLIRKSWLHGDICFELFFFLRYIVLMGAKHWQ